MQDTQQYRVPVASPVDSLLTAVNPNWGSCPGRRDTKHGTVAGICELRFRQESTNLITKPTVPMSKTHSDLPLVAVLGQSVAEGALLGITWRWVLHRAWHI